MKCPRCEDGKYFRELAESLWEQAQALREQADATREQAAAIQEQADLYAALGSDNTRG